MRRLIRNDYIAVKKCKHGTFIYNINDTFIGRSLDLYGEWAETELQILSQVLSSGNTILDVGANIGTHTVFFATKVGPKGRVISFEPQRLIYQMLCGNVAINALLNVTCVNAVVGASPGEVTIPTLDPHSSMNFGALSVAGHATGERVSRICIDDLGLEKCDLIKIDAEGMDLDVLDGAHGVISALKPIISVENNELKNLMHL